MGYGVENVWVGLDVEGLALNPVAFLSEDAAAVLISMAVPIGSRRARTFGHAGYLTVRLESRL
jgi:hypothetical protein